MTIDSSFHIRLYRRPNQVEPAASVEVAGDPVTTVRPLSPLPSFDVSFEEAERALGRFERLFIEPDGAFVWSGESAVGAWRLNGHLYDRHERLLFVELAGSIPEASLIRLLDACGCQDRCVLIEMVRQGVYLEWQPFRQLLP